MKEKVIQERIKNLTSSDFLIYVKEDPEFRKFIKAMPAKHWSKHDISAVRLGWEACKILSLFPSLDNLEVVEECKECAETYFRGGVPHSTVCHCGMQEGPKAKNHTCSRCGYVFPQTCKNCQGEGKVTRAATWDEVKPILIQAISGFQIQGKYFHTKDGGILRVKGEE